MKKIIFKITLIPICNSLFSQTVLTDTLRMFNKMFELSGLTISDNKFYFIGENARKYLSSFITIIMMAGTSI
jgi:hypothetical protein